MKTILLEGTAEAVGYEYGGCIAERLAEMLRNGREHGQARGMALDDLRKRGEEFGKILERVAPHWLEEAKGISQAAGASVTDILMLNALPPGFWNAGDTGCTAFVMVEPARDGGKACLYKIRDERNQPQHVFIKAIRGRRRFLAGGGIGSLGAAQLVNEAGLAMANNTGSILKESQYRQFGLSDVHILRLLGEEASNCRQALEILKNLLADGVVGGAGRRRGMIFLLADAEKGLIIENSSFQCESRFIEQGMEVRSNHFLLPGAKAWMEKPPNQNTVTRYNRISELLNQPRQGKSLFNLCRQISRDTLNSPDALCNDDREHPWMTVSVFIHVINRRFPRELSLAWIADGNPKNTVFFPMHCRETRTPQPLLDGSFNAAARARYAREGMSDCLENLQDELENCFDQRVEQHEKTATADLTAGNADKVRREFAELDITLFDDAHKRLSPST